MKIKDIVIEELVHEAREADLYHGTSIFKAERILETNRFIAYTPVEQSARGFLGGRKRSNLTVSFSRSLPTARKFTSYSKTNIFPGVIFVIDQDLLYRDVGRRMASYNDLLYGAPNTGKTKQTEFEEAVFGNIENAEKYIKEILVFVAPELMDTYQTSDVVNQFPRVLNNPKTKIVPAIDNRGNISGRRELERRTSKFRTNREEPALAEADSVETKKLVIFDIDDTLVNTDTRVDVVRGGQVVHSLNSHEFTHYELQPGEQFDFGRFRNAKEFFDRARPIVPMVNQLNRDIETGNKVIMVTARADFDNRDLFLSTFKRIGVDIDGVDHVYRAGNLTDRVSTEEKKRRVIDRLLRQEHYDKVIMYDDSMPNLNAFISLKQDYPWTDFYAWHVDHSGRASEYHRTKPRRSSKVDEESVDEGEALGRSVRYPFYSIFEVVEQRQGRPGLKIRQRRDRPAETRQSGIYVWHHPDWGYFYVGIAAADNFTERWNKHIQKLLDQCTSAKQMRNWKTFADLFSRQGYGIEDLKDVTLRFYPRPHPGTPTFKQELKDIETRIVRMINPMCNYEYDSSRPSATRIPPARPPKEPQ